MIAFVKAFPRCGDHRHVPESPQARFLIGIISTLACLAGVLSSGCASYTVATEMLQESYPSEFIVRVPVEQAWKTIQSVAVEAPNSRVLVRNDSQHLISWQSRVESSLESASKSEVLSQQEAREVGAGGVAITTILLTSRGDVTVMRVHRTYYGPRTQPKLVWSRGNYAAEIASRLNFSYAGGGK